MARETAFTQNLRVPSREAAESPDGTATSGDVHLVASAGQLFAQLREGDNGDGFMQNEGAPMAWAFADPLEAALAEADVPPDFLDEKERNQGAQPRDPFEGWTE